MIERAFFIHALSPLHAGTGHSPDLIDLPIARMKSTGIPILPGSSIKGVLRDARSSAARGEWLATFGPESANAGDHAGALVVGDARLVALPVRSFKGTFAWVTSPLLLYLAARDLGAELPIPDIAGRTCHAPAEALPCIAHNARLYLQDLEIAVEARDGATKWATFLAAELLDAADHHVFTRRFAVVDDDTMSFLSETATQVDARVRLDPETRTVAGGALWLEESLPPETIMVGLLAADRSRRDQISMTSEEVATFATKGIDAIQFGGKGSTGHGRCRFILAGTNGGQ